MIARFHRTVSSLRATQVTGLIWEQDDNVTAIDWEMALAYAEAFTDAGYDNWRVPNVKELQSIADYSGVFPAIDATKFNPLTTVMVSNDANHGQISKVMTTDSVTLREN